MEPATDDEIRAYDFLLRRQISEDRILGERSSIFLLASSFLFLGFVTLGQQAQILRIVVPSIGILLCGLTYYLNKLAHRALLFWHGGQQKIEKTAASFAFMRNSQIAPHLPPDPNLVEEKSWMFKIFDSLWKGEVGPILAVYLPGIFSILWISSLIWVIWLE